MRKRSVALLLGVALALPQVALGDEAPESLHAFKTTSLEGEEVQLSDYDGVVCLVVNVASKCGLTPQYAGLQKLHEELSDDGFTVLAFPSNDFMGQEPGTAEEIRAFCTSTYNVTFPIFEKMPVTGEEQSAIYRFLSTDFEEPTWNFTKYLVDKEGKVVERFDPRTTPDDEALRAKIDAALSD